MSLISLSCLAQQLQQASQAISGWVADSSCAYTKNLSKPVSPSCAKMCAKGGSPLVIVSDDKNIYLPVDTATPSHSQNWKLLPYAGQHVTVNGQVFERGNSKAINIEKVAAAK